MEPNTQDQTAGAGEYSGAAPDHFDKYSATGETPAFDAEKPNTYREDRRRRPEGGRRGGPRRGSGGRAPRSFAGGYRAAPPEIEARIQEIIQTAEAKLNASHEPVKLEGLNPFERKQIHQHFERRKMLFETKTYRDGEEHVLWVFPVANLKKFAESKAQEALERGEEIALPPMSSYERFIVHNILKEIGSVETSSAGEGETRHIVIRPKKFGRSLRKIAKKIKLF